MLESFERRNSSQAIQNSKFSSLNSDFKNPLNRSNPPKKTYHKQEIKYLQDHIISREEGWAH
jgi:hypothetical protein